MDTPKLRSCPLSPLCNRRGERAYFFPSSRHKKKGWSHVRIHLITLTQISSDLIAVVPGVTIDGNQTQYVAEGNDILLTCRYNASPPASEVQWIKDGNILTTNASVGINDSRVTIPHYNESLVQLLIRNATTPQDAGNYTCDVTNDIGNSSDTTIIVIEGVFLCSEPII